MQCGRKKKSQKEYKCVFSFKDVEKSLETFNGDDNASIIKWLDNFEKFAEMYKWCGMYKVAYARHLLRGSKIFAYFEKCTKTWKKLKNSLIDEFGKAVDSDKIY